MASPFQSNRSLNWLALLVLWNVYRNSILVTWTLPEFGSMFLGFLSILQGIFVSVIGLALIGLAALIAKFVPER